ncbi:hypothetical protein ACFU0W_14230 [Microbacterium keratanolyticum]|uniref:hypothetical protein n=1 Tax=Microbacterium keratanolyticum TaxID=67574 RepID=UPI00363E55C6
MMVEEPLAGGNATAGVVRVGETVRKPWLSSTPAVARLMAVVQDAGIDVPAHLGADAAARLAAIIDGYAPADELRAALPATLCPRAAAMHAMLRDAAASGVEPWSTMFAEGHGAYWAGVAEYARTHEAEWARALDV